MPPDYQFNMRRDDNGQWIVERIFGDEYQASYTFDNADTAQTMLDTLKDLWDEEKTTPIRPFQSNPDADYEKGYIDGKAGNRNSSLIGREAYDIGWLDGEGDRIYDA